MDQIVVSEVTEQLLTPTKISAWLECDHSLTLQRRLDEGTLRLDRTPFGSFAQMLFDKGQQHEAECLDHYRGQGLDVVEIPRGAPGQPFHEWIDDLGDVFDTEADVLYQLPLAHDGIRGIADFVLRVSDERSGTISWEPVDAKLARSAAKPGHVLQLCCYAEAIEAATGHLPEHVHLWLGSGQLESIRTAEVMPYWRRIRLQLANLLDRDPDETATAPVPCSHCEFCDFADVCNDAWRTDDSLVFVAGLRNDERGALEDDGITTLAALASLATPVAQATPTGVPPEHRVPDVRPDRLARVSSQAALQVEARESSSDAPPFSLVPTGADPTWGHGFEQMPEPDDGDVFLDFEGHPFWRADTDLFFLFGWIERDDRGDWIYRALWAHDQTEEATATKELVEHLASRRAAHPGMHVYHYNHTERSSLVRLTERYGVATSTLTELVETGAFVDLMTVVRNSIQAGVESYGLKELERLTDFERSHDISSGSGAVVEYDRWMGTKSPESLDHIAAYNEDDVRATHALRDWLVGERPNGTPWRAAHLELDEPLENHDEQIEALHAFGPDTPEALLGDLLDYWAREGMTHKAQTLAHLAPDHDHRLEDPRVISGLTSVGLVERTHKKHGTPLEPGMGFAFPPQDIGEITVGKRLMYLAADGQTGYTDVLEIDEEAGQIVTSWSERSAELATLPDSVVLNDWVRPTPKPDALSALADEVLDHAPLPSGGAGGLALLRRRLPTFDGGGPADGFFGDDIDEMSDWVSHLDGTTVSVQGPPGTGKTYRGARLVHRLILDGTRVGITAFSHDAIDNLLRGVIDLFDELGDTDRLRAVRKRKKPRDGGVRGVTYIDDNGRVANGDFNLLAGTTWLFANDKVRDNPLDVLIVDEAGQMSLADTLAASTSTRNLILLGDPLQLPQVTIASHPNGSGASALEHVLGDHATLPADRGVFLSETRRMHPDVCRFISDAIYDGRLTSHPDCARQSTEAGTGLRWIPAVHHGCATESHAEAQLVLSTVSDLIDTKWTDQHGESRPVRPDDIMVVAPYNNQVALLREHLDADPATRGVPVGTVDKFQGQEAAVVVYSMTSSSAGDAPRGTDFLFSRNRLNVAISRARCLAYLVCTEQLLNSRARNVEEMKLLSCLASFVEHAEAR